MEKKYFNPYLVEQYKEANGYHFNNTDTLNLNKDYRNWLEERKRQGYRYLDFLYEMRRDILERTTAEVGKTDLDSIVEPFDTTIISPYEFDSLEDKTRQIPAQMQVLDEEICLQFPANDQIRLMVLPRKLNLLMTENPYAPYSIKDWDTLHNSGNYDIAVGIFGSIYDKDIKYKLELLKYLKEKILFGDYKYDLNRDKDIYFAALVSDRKNKVLEKNH